MKRGSDDAATEAYPVKVPHPEGDFVKLLLFLSLALGVIDKEPDCLPFSHDLLPEHWLYTASHFHGGDIG
jgi:hypothetical protein